MKNFTKIFTAAIAVILFITQANAQTTTRSPWRFGIGLEAGAPTGNMHAISNFSLGGTARLQYSVSPDLKVTLTTGYYNFFSKNIPGATTQIGPYTYTVPVHDQGIIPAKLGIKAFFNPSWYFSAEAGGALETRYNSDTKLLLSPGFGYATKSLDVGLRYENFSGQNNSYGLVGLRIAYGLGI